MWKQLQASFHASPHMVRRLLTESTVSLNSALGRFVGAEAYEVAGGTIVRELFSDNDDGYMQDAALVREIAELPGREAHRLFRLEPESHGTLRDVHFLRQEQFHFRILHRL